MRHVNIFLKFERGISPFLFFIFCTLPDMRNRFLLSALVVSGISFSAIAQPSVEQRPARIGGYFKDTTGIQVATNALLYPLDILEDNTYYIKGNFNEKNEFMTGFGFNRPFYARVMDRNKLVKGVYMMPHDEVWVSVADGNVTLNGSNKKLINFMNKIQPTFENAEVELIDTAAFKTMDRVAFINYEKERRDRQLRVVVEYFVGKPALEQEMRKLMESDINYSYTLKMLRYSRSKGKDKRFVFRYNDYMNAILEVPTNDPAALQSPAYVQYVYELPYSLWYAEVNWSMTDKPPYNKIVSEQYTMRDSLAKKYFAGEVYELGLYAILLDAVKEAAQAKGTPEFASAYTKAEGIINDLGRQFSNGIYRSRISEKLAELKVEKRPEPKPAPPTRKKKK